MALRRNLSSCKQPPISEQHTGAIDTKAQQTKIINAQCLHPTQQGPPWEVPKIMFSSGGRGGSTIQQTVKHNEAGQLDEES